MSSLLEGKEKKWVCLSFALAFLAMILFYFATLTKVTSIPADAQFGLLSVISPLWFISYALIIISVLIIIFKTKKEAYFLGILFLFLIVLYGAGVFGEALPRAHDTYWHTGAALRLMDNGMLDFSNYLDLNNYYEQYTVQYVSQSPGAFLVISNMLLLTGAEDYIFTFLYLIPILLITLIAFMNYVMFKRFFEKRNAALYTLILLTLNTYFQWHLSPFALGLIIFPLVLMLLFRSKNNIEKYCGYGIFIILATCSLPLFFLIILLVLIYIVLCKIKKIGSKLIIKEILIIFGFLFLILLILNFNGIILESINLLVNSSNSGPTVSSKPLFFNYSTLFRLVILIIVSILIIFLFFNYTKKIYEEDILIFSFFITAALFFILQYSLIPELNLVDRAYFMFYYGGILYFGLKLKTENKILKIITILLLIFAIINSLTLYYSEGYYLFSESDVEAYNFIEQTTSNEFIFGGKDVYILNLQLNNQSKRIDFFQKIDSALLNKESNYDLIILNEKTLFLGQVYNNLEEYNLFKLFLIESKEIDKIYESSDYVIYYH